MHYDVLVTYSFLFGMVLGDERRIAEDSDVMFRVDFPFDKIKSYFFITNVECWTIM